MSFNIFSKEAKNRIIQTNIFVPEELMILVCFEFGTSLEEDLRYINNYFEGIGVYWNFSETDNGYNITLSHFYTKYYVLTSIEYNFFLKIAKYIKDDSFVSFRSYKNPAHEKLKHTMLRFYFKEKEFIIQKKLVDIFKDSEDNSWEDLKQEEVLRFINDNDIEPILPIVPNNYWRLIPWTSPNKFI